MEYNRFKNNNRRRRRNFRNRRSDDDKNASKCPLCDKPVRELHNAIHHKDSGQPSHFDCVLKQLAQTESLAANEKICYLGKGSFGIVRYQKMSSSFPFIIRKRIQYEMPDEVQPWRKSIKVTQ